MPMRPEPDFAHDRSPRVGVLLVNLGTPDAPTPSAVRRYLAEFLADPRVVEIPRAVWLPILHGVILRVRPAKSAAKYAKIWANEGSPLLVHSQRQRSLLQGALYERLKAAGLPSDFVQVEIGMRYGNPAVGSALDALRAGGCDRVLVVPLYPQYAASTTASTIDAVSGWLRGMRRVPGLRFVDCFHDHPAYVAALARNLEDFWMKQGRPDRLLLSFHGVPRRTLERGDPYFCQCQKTARLLTEALGLAGDQVHVTFQSRFGRAEWLKPYTQDTVVALARDGVRRVDVACPGFVADCLETLEEIGMEVRKAFLDAGGAEFNVVPCLNEHPRWIAALADIVVGNLQGWLAAPPEAAVRELTQLRAKGMGAAR